MTGCVNVRSSTALLDGTAMLLKYQKIDFQANWQGGPPWSIDETIQKEVLK